MPPKGGTPYVRTFLTTVLLFGSSLMLAAQGYIYTFQGLPGYQQLDGSYIILSNAVAGPPTSADLLDIKILDSFGSSVFSMTVSPQNFNITAFDDQGFTGDMMGPCGSYTGNTIVRLVGLGTASQTGIYASDNGFFPGQPCRRACLRQLDRNALARA